MYSYEEEKPWLFTDSGFKAFISFRDAALKLMRATGAAEVTYLMGMKVPVSDTFQMLACIDRMVEIGDIQRVCGTGSQGSVYVPRERT